MIDAFVGLFGRVGLFGLFGLGGRDGLDVVEGDSDGGTRRTSVRGLNR